MVEYCASKPAGGMRKAASLPCALSQAASVRVDDHWQDSVARAPAKRTWSVRSEVCHLLGQRPTNEDRVINETRTVGAQSLRFQGVADGHGGSAAAEVVQAVCCDVFCAALARSSMNTDCEINRAMLQALEATNEELQERVAALPSSSGGTTLVLVVWQLDDDDALRGWALVVGDSQFVVAGQQDGDVFNCVVGQKDLATQRTIMWDTPRVGLSTPQAVGGYVHSAELTDAELLSLGRPLAPQDVREFKLTMEGDPSGRQLHEVIVLNQSKVSNPTQQVLVPGGRQGKYIHDLQCTRSFESEPALRVTQGVAYMLVVPAKELREAGGVRCVCFCDGFVDNDCLSGEQITRCLGHGEPVAGTRMLGAFGGEPGVLRGTLLESRLADHSGRYARVQARVAQVCGGMMPALPPMSAEGSDPAASLRWLEEFHLHHEVPRKIGMIDAPWRRGIAEAIAHWKRRLPELSKGHSHGTLRDVAYLAALRLSADNISGVDLAFSVASPHS